MTSGRRRLGVAATTIAALGVIAAPANADTAYGLLAGGTKLTTFDTAAPNQQSSPVAITGLSTGETVVGIDVRPADGNLYAIGKNGTAGRLLKLNPVTGTATPVGTLVDGAANGPAIVLEGTEFDIDFNPAADRLRVVSDADQNLRINPANGVVAQVAMGTPGDGDLAFGGADANAGDDPDVGHAAYTNSFAGTTTTTLYNVDAGNDVLVTQNPPNNGTLNTVGPIGVDVTNVGGFDIIPGSNRALALVNIVSGTPSRRIATIDLTTGAATLASGAIGGTEPLVDLAVAAKDTVTFVGLASPAGAAQQLFTFRSDAPDVITRTVNVTGLPAGETLLAIDSRPRTGQVYGITTASKVYLLDPDTGAATAPANNTLAVPLEGTRFGLDFNPAADRLRIVSDAEQNLRVDVTNAAGGTAMNGSPDGDLPAGDVVHTAYTNSVPDAASTQQFYVDHVKDEIQLTSNPNAPATGGATVPFGTAAGANVVGALQVDITDRGGFDIVGPFNRRVGAFATAAAPTSYGLYTIGAEGGLSSEAKAIRTGTIAVPGGAPLDGLTALAGDTVRMATSTATVTEDGTAATVSIVREGALDSAATVGYGTFDGTATAGADYTATTGTVTFAPGESVKDVVVPILDDAAVEGSEILGFTLTTVTNGARIAQPSVTALTILDDEVPASEGSGPPQTVFVPFPVAVPGAPGTPATPANPAFAFVRASTDEIRMRTLRTRGFLVRVYCSQECRVSGTLRTSSSALARRTGRVVSTINSTTVRAGQTRLIRVRLTTRARRALANTRSATFRLPLRIQPTGGTARNVRSLTVRAFR